MSDAPETTPAPPRATTAGGLLRQARQAQGLHIAALAAAIKVVPRKLELLESDQFDQLPDATFTRALAQTICRTLKIDAVPILALLPPPGGYRLEQVAEGLNTPFNERPGRLEPKEWVSIGSPTLWIVALLVIATVVIYVMPPGWLSFARPGAASKAPPAAAGKSVETAPLVSPSAVELSASAASGTSPNDTAIADGPADSTAIDAATSGPSGSSGPAGEPAATAAVPEATGILQMRATAQSWVEVTDGRGRALISRVVEPGESVGVDGDAPFKIKIGNAGATELTFRGRPVSLASHTRDNVARFELK